MIFSLKEMCWVLSSVKWETDIVEEEDFPKGVLFELRSTAKMELNGGGDSDANGLGRGRACVALRYKEA